MIRVAHLAYVSHVPYGAAIFVGSIFLAGLIMLFICGALELGEADRELEDGTAVPGKTISDHDILTRNYGGSAYDRRRTRRHKRDNKLTAD